jgi:hypothetical protein
VILHGGDLHEPDSIDFDAPEIDVSAGDYEVDPQPGLAADNVEPQPTTPKSSNDHFDLEDLFKSPMPNPEHVPISLNDREEAHSLLELSGIGETDQIDSSGRESGEVSPRSVNTSQPYSEKLLVDGSPSPAKRSRPEDDISLAEDGAPDLKRHRSN